MAMQQADMNSRLGIPSEFLLLNPPTRRGFAAFREGSDFAIVDAKRGDVEGQLAALEQMLQATRPHGPTPLADRLREVHHRLQHYYGHWADEGSQFVVVVATDGLPTCPSSGVPSQEAQQEVTQVLRKLTAELPVFMVVRLTTDDDAVVRYYNRIDEEEELPLEVIDDIESEAREVAGNGNGWLTYSPLLHMIREGGTFLKLLDALDERALCAPEVQSLAASLLEHREEDAQLPNLIPVDLFNFACKQLHGLSLVYDPISKRMMPCLQQRKLRRALEVSRVAVWCSSGRQPKETSTAQFIVK